ncbi:IclR family transcriptional regulator [Ammoniphilus sp. YIM 78166]|uniref:IclR family transcriptional regulator n=1 Tax=Ammoniphilus sp. YIM 78166 TaxID=1644106 RepID=UPI00106FAFB6|nr:IclR family transcriptional regulator [Ammoniphilus sp. YIM 78166]
MKESGQTVQSVERAMRIMECFTLEKPQQTLGELAAQTNLSKSTVYRLLSTLEGIGYIKQDDLTQKYSLGFKVFFLGSVVTGNLSLRETALPFMRKLGEEISETVDLNIIEGGQRVCIEMVESSEQIRNIVKVGQRNALWVGASGRVLLANLEAAERQNILQEAVRQNQLDMDQSVLEEKLDLIRTKGYAISIDERVKGSFAIASPIFTHEGKLAGGVTAAGPIHRLSGDQTPFVIQQVMHTAYQISQAMGDIQAKNRYPSMITA